MFDIFISSCIEGIDYQVPRIIENIINVENIPLEKVHIIIGGCKEEKEYYLKNIHIIEVIYRCFEFTPLIFICNNNDKFNFEYAFFTHDTVKFGKNFYNIINNDIEYLKKNNYDTMKIENVLPSMNIGIYSKNIILKNTETLLNLSCYSNDKDTLFNLKKNLVKYEDFILNQNNYKIKDTARVEKKILKGIYNTVSKNSSIKYFERIDFIKYQSNSYIISTIDICII